MISHTFDITSIFQYATKEGKSWDAYFIKKLSLVLTLNVKHTHGVFFFTKMEFCYLQTFKSLNYSSQLKPC